MTGGDNGWEGFSDEQLRDTIGFMRHLLHEMDLDDFVNDVVLGVGDDDFEEDYSDLLK